MKLEIGTTEMLDWQTIWCSRCQHDHAFSHGSNWQLPDPQGDGCPLLVKVIHGEDLPEMQPRRPDALCYIPAEVSCSQFTLCTSCAPERADAERRGGETRREFRDRLRGEMLARPVVIDADA